MLVVELWQNNTLHLSHGFQCSPTLNCQPYEGRLPLTSWWRKSSNMTVGQSSLISLAYHCYDWHPGSRCGWTCNPDKTEWRLISATLCRWRRCLVADQSWFMKRIREVFGSVLKRQCLKRSWVQVKLYFVTFNSNCRLHTVAVGKPSERMSNFWTVGFSKSNPNRFSMFHTSLQISCVIVVFVIFGCFWFICKLSTFVANSFSCRLKFMYVVCGSY